MTAAARPPAVERSRAKRLRRASHLAVWALSLTPAVVTLVQALTWRLGFDPVAVLVDRTGWWAVVHLLATLAVTPMRRLTGWQGVVRYRRQLGLGAFVYATLHLGVYAVLDLGLDVAHLAGDLLRPFIAVGTVAWLVLLALAVTSTRGWMARLGRRWQTLHRFVYAAAALVSLHFAQARKTLEPEPLLFAAAFAALLAVRAVLSLRSRRSRAARSLGTPASTGEGVPASPPAGRAS